MSEFEAHLGLLPTGFVDLMPEEAEKEAAAINALMGLFSAYGYSRIKPPMMEFEESLLAPGPGASLNKETFRVMDPVSRRMLGVRADITPQIARIVCTRLPKDVTPIRLAYANDVLRASSGQLRTSRQFCQVGCEIIRDESVESYQELAMLAVLGLKSLGIAGVTVDFTVPRLLDTLIAEHKIEPETESALRAALDRRDRARVSALDVSCGDVILALLDLTGHADKALKGALALKLPKSIAAEFEKLNALVAQIQEALADLGITDVSLTFDAFETKGFEYHNGIAFTLFSRSIRGELGRGGHYTVSFGGGKQAGLAEKAIGFTLYMDTIRPSVTLEKGGKAIAVPAAERWDVLEDLRAQGWRVVRIIDEAYIPPECTHIYKNGKTEERK